MILGIDAGTTGITIVIADKDGSVISKAHSEFTQHYPKPGWVEHDPNEIWDVTQDTIKQAISAENINHADIKAIGITNQRETTVIWNRQSSEPVYNAIVWQCRRTADICEQIRREYSVDKIKAKTGLVLDAYFSATKIKWILDNVEGARQAADNEELCFGTIDSWLVWKLSGQKVHRTDYTNASRTMLFNIHDLNWDNELLDVFSVPESVLPEVVNSSSHIAETNCDLFEASIPITGIAGDQQAALYGQNCWQDGWVKNTYGTGCFMMMYTGKEAVNSQQGLLTTIACDQDGQPAYALEGAVFSAGATIQWLRDELHLIEVSAQTEIIAQQIEDTQGVYFVPAFVGLGAPYWNMDVRAAIMGLTRGSGRKEIIRAALESLAYQSKDLLDVMSNESGQAIQELRVDGGACQNNFLMQFQADLIGCKVVRPQNIESTVMGAIMLAGRAIDFWSNQDELSQIRREDRSFNQEMDHQRATQLYAGWQEAVQQLIK